MHLVSNKLFKLIFLAYKSICFYQLLAKNISQRNNIFTEEYILNYIDKYNPESGTCENEVNPPKQCRILIKQGRLLPKSAEALYFPHFQPRINNTFNTLKCFIYYTSS